MAILGLDPAVQRSPHVRLLFACSLIAAAVRHPPHIWCDTWFNLVLGREIAYSGLVTTNNLTRVGLGAPCVDQQWLAHLLWYQQAVHFGISSVAFTSALLTAGSILAAVLESLRRGATHGRALVVGLIALAVVTSQSMARAQSLALPFVAALFIVMLRDQAAPRGKTWLFVPCVALWANLHGSVLLAPAVATLATAARVTDAFRRGEKIARDVLARDIALALAFSAAVFASPYALQMPQYYRSTFANPLFRSYISEWATSSVAEAPAAWLLILLAFGLAILRLRAAPAFESVTCLLLAVAAASSIRHGALLAILAAIVLPRFLDDVLPGALFRFHEDRPIRWASRALLPLGVLLFPTIPFHASWWLDHDLRKETTDRVAAAAEPGRLVFADEAQADRLLWFHPELKGRVSHDVRIETMPSGDLDAVASLYGTPSHPKSRQLLDDYDVVVTDRTHAAFAEWMDQDPVWAKVDRDCCSAVFVRSDRTPPDRRP